MKLPVTIRHTRKILGVLNYYRKLIPDFAKIALPITDMLKGFDSRSNGKLPSGSWKKEHQESFEKLKSKLLSAPCLNLYNPEAQTFMEVDASNYALGAVLKQIDPISKKVYIIGYFSEKIPSFKKHLGSFDLELLAITRACEYFRQYLLEKKFTVFTDNEPLTFQSRSKTPNYRLARLITKLSEFSFNLKHISGVKNVTADFLSRHPTDAIEFEKGQFTSPQNDKNNLCSKCKEEISINIMTRSKTRKRDQNNPNEETLKRKEKNDSQPQNEENGSVYSNQTGKNTKAPKGIQNKDSEI